MIDIKLAQPVVEIGKYQTRHLRRPNYPNREIVGGQMYQIVYTSRARRTLTDGEVDALGTYASQSNHLANVTGLLLYDGKRFIQALEGDQPSVEKTMSRIVKDRRHHRITIMNRGPIAARQFGEWSMDYRRAQDDCCTSKFLDSVKSGMVSVDDPVLQAAFIGFASLATSLGSSYQCKNSVL